MELDIEEKLQEIYENLTIEVTFEEIRHYGILVHLEHKQNKYESKIIYKYDTTLTLDANIHIIENIIDNKIIIPFYKKKGE